MTKPNRIFMLAFCFVAFIPSTIAQVDPALFSDMHWREIGLMRAGRRRALAGVPSEPAAFYLGAVNGGVWKTTDGGEGRRGRGEGDEIEPGDGD